MSALMVADISACGIHLQINNVIVIQFNIGMQLEYASNMTENHIYSRLSQSFQGTK